VDRSCPLPFVAADICLWGGYLSCGRRHGQTRDLPILQKWSGNYPVAELKRLPEGQRKTRVGFFGDGASFADAWPAFKPGEKVPEVNFTESLVVFSRNMVFYNRTSIAKVTIQDGVAEVMAFETMSSAPVEDKAAMAMAVIPREG